MPHNAHVRGLGAEDRKRLKAEYSDTLGAGVYTLRLDNKAWGKSMSLWCFFTVEGTGERVAINCFRSRKDGKTYGPRDDAVDLSVAGIEGGRYQAELTVSGAGYMNLKTARKLA